MAWRRVHAPFSQWRRGALALAGSADTPWTRALPPGQQPIDEGWDTEVGQRGYQRHQRERDPKDIADYAGAREERPAGEAEPDRSHGASKPARCAVGWQPPRSQQAADPVVV